MKKVLLVTSSLLSDDVSLPVGVLRIASVLKRTGKYTVEVVDIDNLIKDGMLHYKDDIYSIIDEFVDYIVNQEPDAVGFSCMCNNFHIFLEICEGIKRMNPDIKLFLGGPQATLTASKTIRTFKFIDLICLGESEETIEDVVDYLLDENKNGAYPRGAVLRDREEIIENKELVVTDLEKMGEIDYDLIPFIDGIKVFSIEGGRGCPFACVYCSTKNFFKKKYRLRPLEQIADEMQFIYERYGKKLFNIEHDLFTVDKRRIMQFCDILIQRNMDIEWYCSARIDTIDRELALKLKKARCEGIFIGIETGSQRMQELTKKRLNLVDAKQRAQMLYDVGIKDVTFSFIYGFEDEREDDIRATLNLILELYSIGFRDIFVNRLTVLAGTELYERYKNSLEYSGKKTFLNHELQRSKYESVVRDNPEIFPQYFVTEKLTVDVYEFIDGFISSLCKCGVQYFGETFNLIVKHFDNDLYEVYKHMKETDEKIFKFNSKQKSGGRLPEEVSFVLSGFRYYIKYGDFKEDSREIQTSFKEEMKKLKCS